MSKFFHLAKRARKSTKTKKTKMIRPSVKILNLAIIGLIIFSGISYLIQVNSLMTKGYLIEDLEDKISRLEQKTKDLELETLELQSMESVKGKISQLEMVEAGSVEYLQVAPLVAAR